VAQAADARGVSEHLIEQLEETQRLASRHFFGKPAQQLSAEECALLAAVLPNPVELKVAAPSEYVRKRQSFILGQMHDLETKTRLLADL